MPEYDTVPCPKCGSMTTQTTNERSGTLGRPMLVWRCRTCGKVAYDSAAQLILSQQRTKKNQLQKEQPMTTDTPTTQPAVQPTEQAPATTTDTPSRQPHAMTEAELEARWDALQQARELRSRHADLSASLLAMQKAVAQLETDIAFATRKALAQ